MEEIVGVVTQEQINQIAERVRESRLRTASGYCYPSPCGDMVKLNSEGTVQSTDNPVEAIGEVTTVTAGGSSANVKLYPYPGSGSAPTPVPPPIPWEIQAVPEEAVLRHMGGFNVMTEWYECTIKISLEAVRRIPDRRAFRKRLGERLQAVYQEALAEWEKIHGEEEG